MREIQPRLNFGGGKDAMEWRGEPQGGGGRLGGGRRANCKNTEHFHREKWLRCLRHSSKSNGDVGNLLCHRSGNGPASRPYLQPSRWAEAASLLHSQGYVAVIISGFDFASKSNFHARQGFCDYIIIFFSPWPNFQIVLLKKKYKKEGNKT